MLTSAKYSAKERWNERRTNTGICVRGSGADLCNTMQNKRVLEQRRTTLGICVRGSGVLTPLQHNALQRSAGISNKDWHPCQRIRMLTPLQHNAFAKGALEQANKHGMCQRIRMLTPLQHNVQRRWNGRNTGICVRGSGMLTSVTQCTAKKGAGMSAEQTLAAVPRIRNADSSATTMHRQKSANRAYNNTGICVRERGCRPLCNTMHQRALEQRRTKTGICVRGSGMLTSANTMHCKGALNQRRTKTGIRVRGSGMLTPKTQCTTKR
jgi:hypothetical protein